MFASYDASQFAFVEGAFIARAAAIRGARRSGKRPFALPGLHCTNKFGYVCGYYDRFCKDGLAPAESADVRHAPNDPGSKAIEFSGADLADPELVILSASSYDSGSRCMEKYALDASGYDAEQSEALDTGTVLHVGASALYEHIMLEQNRRVP